MISLLNMINCYRFSSPAGYKMVKLSFSSANNNNKMLPTYVNIINSNDATHR